MVKKKKKILLAEDETVISKALCIKLSEQGYLVDVVRNGKDAINKLKEKSYDLLLLDLMMPVINGFGVLAAITTEDIDIDVIVLSNLSKTEDRKKTAEYGVKEFLIKANLSVNDIIDTVKKYL